MNDSRQRFILKFFSGPHAGAEVLLPPGDYRERKPKGWRWKLPWSHDDDTYELVGCKRQPYVSLVHFR